MPSGADLERYRQLRILGLDPATPVDGARLSQLVAENATVPLDYISVTAYGAKGDGVTDDSDSFNRAIIYATSAELGVFIPEGTYKVAGVNLPDFTQWEDATSVNRPFSLLGAGAETTRLEFNPESDARYLVGHPSVGGVTTRGQNSYQTISGFTLIGAKDYTRNIPVLALSNTYKGHVRDLHVEGCPGGPAIWNYSHFRGGSQALVIEHCSTYKGEWEVTDDGSVYDINILRQRGVRYFVHNDGPNDAIGKANDTIIRNCHVYDCLIGCINTIGHGALNTGSSSFPDGGGTDNLTIENCFFAAQGTRKMEEGTLSSVASTTEVALKLDNFINDTTDVFQNCRLKVQDTSGKWHSRWIDTYTSGTRVVTFADELSFTPTTSSNYRIQYGDQESRDAGWSSSVDAHGLLWASWLYRARVVDCRFEEIRSIVATTYANYDVMMEFPYEVANDVQYGLRTDGTDWRPKVWIADRARGNTTSPADLQVKTLLLGDPTDESKRAVLVTFINDSGLTLKSGSVASVKTDGVNVGAANGSTDQLHVVVYNPAYSEWANGERLTAAVSGIVPILVNTSGGAVATGDLIIPLSSEEGGVLSPASATVQQLSRALAKALHSAVSTGAQPKTVLCKLL